MVQFIAKLTAAREDPTLVRGESEKKYLISARLKKQVFEKGTENVKDGTGSPWGSVTVRGFDPATIEEFKGMALGSDVVISITPRRARK